VRSRSPRPGMNARATDAAPGKPASKHPVLKPHSWGAALAARRFIAGRGGAVLSLLLLAAAPLAAQAPRLDLALSPREVTVGDPVEVILTLQAPAATLAGDPRFPVWGASWGDAELLEKGEAQKTGESGGIATWRQRIVIAAYRTGKVDLPPVQVAVPQKDRTLQVQTPAGSVLAVRSVLPPNEKEPKPRPPAALRPLPIGAPFWWTLAGMSALCALLGWMLWRQSRRRQSAAEAARPALPPFEELTAALDALAAEPSMVRLHTRLSLALRRYLGRALRVPAPESTTSEVHRLLVARRLPAPLVRQTVELLRACDLVKFARQEVGTERGQERAAAARQLGRDIKKHVQPPPLETDERLEKAG
jgi:hypothetical protein